MIGLVEHIKEGVRVLRVPLGDAGEGSPEVGKPLPQRLGREVGFPKRLADSLLSTSHSFVHALEGEE